jgi:hypothetical protein
MHKVIRRLCWTLFVPLVAGAGPAASLIDNPAVAAPVNGGLIADPAKPSRLKYFNGGPAFIASVGDPEGFLYRGTKNANGTRSGDQDTMINELQARGLNSLFVIGFNDSRYGGDGPADGNPFVNANTNGQIDVDILNQWYSWFQTLDAAGIVVIFSLYDDLIDVLAGKRMNWDLSGGNLHPQEQKYVDAVVNKFKTLKNLIWVINESANKTYPSNYVERWKKIAARIRSLDTFLHPISIGIVVETDPNVTPNTGMPLYLDDPNFDQILVQHVQPTSVVDMYNKMLAQWNAAAGKINLLLAQAWPVNNGADGRKKNWATAMAGSYVNQAYGQPGKVWDILASPDADLNALGLIDNFFRAIPSLNKMVPRNNLKFGNTKFVLAVPGQSYVAYSDQASGNLGVQGLTSGTYNLKWLDTVDGSTVVQNGVAVTTAATAFLRPSSIQLEAALYIAKQ